MHRVHTVQTNLYENVLFGSVDHPLSRCHCSATLFLGYFYRSPLICTIFLVVEQINSKGKISSGPLPVISSELESQMLFLLEYEANFYSPQVILRGLKKITRQ